MPTVRERDTGGSVPECRAEAAVFENKSLVDGAALVPDSWL
jgi:hypothetical protein